MNLWKNGVKYFYQHFYADFVNVSLTHSALWCAVEALRFVQEVKRAKNSLTYLSDGFTLAPSRFVFRLWSPPT